MRRKWSALAVALVAVATVGCEDMAEPVAAQEAEVLGEAVAQEGAAAGLMRGGMAGMVLRHADALELTAEQRSRIQAVHDRTRAAAAPLEAQLREIHQGAAEATRSVLTEAQLSTLRGLRPGAAGRGDMRGMRGMRGPAGPGMGAGQRGAESMGAVGLARRALVHGDEIGLTAGQRSSLEALVTELRASRPPEGATREERRAAMAAAMTSARERVEAILTAEQIEQLRAMGPVRGPRRDGAGRGPGGGGDI